ncbi:MAG: DUF493 domain-containing protein [Deltaproteobacteria bacterium]|nr:MAG: DUF493 domain-containing protein [Deltaproteobacteria bacterium]
MVGEKFDKMKSLLEDQHDFPCTYTFKFVVPADKIETLENLVKEGSQSKRPSSSGKYISLTIVMEVSSSDHVIEVYERVQVIDGLISL